MKSIIMFLMLSATVAQASVDYIAIGALIRTGKKEIASARAGISCLMNDYKAAPSCEKIEYINEQANNLYAPASYESFNVECKGNFYDASNVTAFREYYTDKARALASDAPDNDTVHSAIKSLENSHNQLLTDVANILSEAKFQETYVRECL